MQGDAHPSRVALRAARERALEHLSEAFTKDEIGLDEFERRVDLAYGCSTEEALLALVADLSPHAAAASTAIEAAKAIGEPPRAEVIVRAELVPVKRQASSSNRSITVLGNLERRGKWSLVSGARVLAVLGNVELDLREVDLPDGVTELYVRAVLGNIEIVVPPDLAVECDGSGFLGSFAVLSRTPAGGGRLLRVIGAAVLGNVEVRTLPRGASRNAKHLLISV